MYDGLMIFCNILLFIIGLLYVYRSVYAVLGVFYPRKYASAKKNHKYAVIVAARNEEAACDRKAH